MAKRISESLELNRVYPRNWLCWIKKTIRNVMTVVAVLSANSQVSLNWYRGPMQSQSQYERCRYDDRRRLADQRSLANVCANRVQDPVRMGCNVGSTPRQSCICPSAHACNRWSARRRSLTAPSQGHSVILLRMSFDIYS